MQPVGPRALFLIYDTQAQQWTSFQNLSAGHGWGRIAQFASEKGVEVILGAAPGLNTKAALDTMGIRVAVSAGVTAQKRYRITSPAMYSITVLSERRDRQDVVLD